jgi:hypothetical protein
MSEGTDRVIIKQGIVNGILLGIVVAAIYIFKFYFLTQMVTSAAMILAGYFLLFPWVLPLAAAAFSILKLREKIGGYWSFKKAVRGAFIILVTAYVTQFIFNDIIFNRIIEPNVAEKSEQALIRSAITDFKKRHISQKDIDQKVKEIKENLGPTKQQVSVGQQVINIGINIIFLFVLSLIFAGFFKRELLYYNSNRQTDATV